MERLPPQPQSTSHIMNLKPRPKIELPSAYTTLEFTLINASGTTGFSGPRQTPSILPEHIEARIESFPEEISGYIFSLYTCLGQEANISQ